MNCSLFSIFCLQILIVTHYFFLFLFHKWWNISLKRKWVLYVVCTLLDSSVKSTWLMLYLNFSLCMLLTLFSTLLYSTVFLLIVTLSSNYERFNIIFLRNTVFWKMLFCDMCGVDMEESEDTWYFLSCILKKKNYLPWLTLVFSKHLIQL